MAFASVDALFFFYFFKFEEVFKVVLMGFGRHHRLPALGTMYSRSLPASGLPFDIAQLIVQGGEVICHAPGSFMSLSSDYYPQAKRKGKTSKT